MVARYVRTADDYEKILLNLTVEETRLVEVFDESGRLDKRREIVSNLVIYQPQRGSAAEKTEYRDVHSVDGKPIKKRSNRALELLARASQSNSIQKELEMIDRESGRYDLNFHFVGSTDQGGAAFRAREKFRVNWVGRDQVNGHDVVVLNYQDAPSRNNPDQQFLLPNRSSPHAN